MRPAYIAGTNGNTLCNSRQGQAASEALAHMQAHTDMTEIYSYNPQPDVITVRCPRCSSAATFRFPFTFLSDRASDLPAIEAARQDPTVTVEHWGGWHVVVHFPRIFPWETPSNGYQRANLGVCACSRCGYLARRKLSWPADAYFACEVKGKQLWAWNREHALAIKSFIESKERKPWRHRGYALSLLHIPTIFLLAKNRDAVVRRLQRILEP
jgi:hypothetical protein